MLDVFRVESWVLLSVLVDQYNPPPPLTINHPLTSIVHSTQRPAAQPYRSFSWVWQSFLSERWKLETFTHSYGLRYIGLYLTKPSEVSALYRAFGISSVFLSHDYGQTPWPIHCNVFCMMFLFPRSSNVCIGVFYFNF